MTPLSAAEFYDAALAKDGYYYLGPKAGKRLIKDRPSFDKRLGPTPDLYHSLARFRDPKGGRKMENIISLRSFRLDVDTKQTHSKAPYDDLPEARVAVNDFVTMLGLPMPWLIDSGGGWHVYWMLDADVPHDEWRATAEMLKTATVQASLDNDRAIIADGTRLMRAVGSLHGGLGKEVSIARRGAPAGSHAALRAILERFVGTATPAPASFNANGNGNGNMLTNVRHADSYADAAADQCLLLNDLRAGVDQDYNLWIAGLSNMARMVDGPDKAHEWSKRQRPKEYDEAETDAKLREFKGPHTCGKVAALSGAPCGSCPHYLVNLSPVRLGEGGPAVQPAPAPPISPIQPPPPPPPSQPPVATPQPAPAPAPVPPPSGLPPPPLPYLTGNYPANGFVEIFPAKEHDAARERFFWYYEKDPAGLKHPFKSTVCVRKGTAKKGQTITTLAEGAFYAVGMVHGSAHTLQCYFRYPTAFGKNSSRGEEISLPSSIIHGPTLATTLGEKGLSVAGLAATNAMRSFIHRWYEAARTYAPIAGGETFGLQPDGTFAVGHHLVQDDGSVVPATAIGDGAKLLTQFNSLPDTSPAMLLAKAREWGRQVDKLFNHDELVAHQFMILCSFASMLWSFSSVSFRGMVISAFGTATGLAKSSCVRVAGSVWGNDQYIMSAAGTAGAICGKAAAFNSLPLAIDEVTKGINIVQLITDLGNGFEKPRLNQNAKLRDTKQWQLLTMVTSNFQLSGFTTGQQGADGVNARLWELPFDPDALGALRRRLHQQQDPAMDPADFESNKPDKAIATLCRDYGGYAGLLFTATALPRRTALAKRIAAVNDCLYTPDLPEGPNRGAVNVAACVLTSLALLQQLDVLHFDFAKMEAWIVGQLKARTATIQSTSYSPRNAYTYALSENHSTVLRCVTEPGVPGVRTTSSLDPRSIMAIEHTIVRAGGDERYLYLFRPTLNSWFGADGQTVLATLRAEGVLLDEHCMPPAELTSLLVTPVESYKINLNPFPVAAAAPAAKPAPMAGTKNVYPLATG